MIASGKRLMFGGLTATVPADTFFKGCRLEGHLGIILADLRFETGGNATYR